MTSSQPTASQLPDVHAMRQWFMGLQTQITDAIAALENRGSAASAQHPSASFLTDPWTKEPGASLQGSGITKILENGCVFERAGCGFSHVSGPSLPPSATARRPELAGAPFEAMGVSLVFHPRNPWAPTAHMNVRVISATPAGASQPVRWFGGGMDLTPIYGFEDDARDFHRACRDALAPFGAQLYPRFKQWCDEYFYLPHRGEQRGVGGIFFDDWASGDATQDWAMLRSVGEAFAPIYTQLVERRCHTPYTAHHVEFQRWRRARYVEFNLVFDRGTHFGLQSGGRTQSILLSMPLHASWSYQRNDPADSPEAALVRDFLIRRDWLSE